MGKNSNSIEQKWKEMSEAALRQAEKLPHGPERDRLLKEARQLRTASEINQWLASSELNSPR